MSIPDYQTLMKPVLLFCAEGQPRALKETTQAMARHFSLTEAELAKRIPSGTQGLLSNRVGWARTYMKKAGLLFSPKRGEVQITDRGLEVLKEDPEELNVAYLRRFPEFQAFQKPRTREKEESPNAPTTEVSDPHELLASSIEEIHGDLADELLQEIAQCSPAFFEQLIIDLLLAMGYGGSLEDAGSRLGRSGDGGIDGIIKEDKLGLDNIYLQAKRWTNTVGRPEVQQFAGALQGNRARKGVFITTSSFSTQAEEFAQHLDIKIALIDGQELAQLMIEHGVGVSTVRRVEVKRIDGDYFEG